MDPLTCKKYICIYSCITSNETKVTQINNCALAAPCHLYGPLQSHIPCIEQQGFDLLDGLGMAHIASATFSLSQSAYARLLELQHYNGAPVVVIYGGTNFTSPAIQVRRTHIHIEIIAHIRRESTSSALG